MKNLNGNNLQKKDIGTIVNYPVVSEGKYIYLFQGKSLKSSKEYGV